MVIENTKQRLLEDNERLINKVIELRKSRNSYRWQFWVYAIALWILAMERWL